MFHSKRKNRGRRKKEAVSGASEDEEEAKRKETRERVAKHRLQVNPFIG
jgi:hypothetical protein